MNSDRPPLQAPLGRLLDASTARPALQRMRARVLAHTRQNPGRGWRFRLGWGLATTVVVAAALLGVLGRGAPASLLTRDGQEFRELSASDGLATQYFADGSSLSIGASGRVVALSSTPQEFSILLERGRLDIHVVPGGPRRWVIEGKWARVEVVGTRFFVERKPTGLSVGVSEGVVVVRSALLPEGVMRLAAGQSLDVLSPTNPPVENRLPLAAPTLPLEPPQAIRETRDASPTAPATVHVRTLIELLDEADRARARGAWPEAEGALAHIVAEYPTDARSSLAGYGLGVVQLRRGKQMVALETFEWVLGQRPPRSLWEDTLLRLIELHASLGQMDRAAERTAEYRARFPEGRHQLTIERLVPRTP